MNSETLDVSPTVKLLPASVTFRVFVAASKPGVRLVTVAAGNLNSYLQVWSPTQVASKDAAKITTILIPVATLSAVYPVVLILQVNYVVVAVKMSQ
jgi:hypothetical protein